MATVQAVKPIITPFDRFGLTLSIAILVHAIVILGITFIEEDRSRARYDTMEIVIVQQKSPEPKEADMLAQASLEGGGNVEEVLNPATPLPAPFPDPEPDITPPPPVETQPPQPPEPVAAEVEVPEPEPVKKEVVEKIAVENEKSPDPVIEKVETPAKEKKITEEKEIKTKETKPNTVKEKKKVKETIKKPKMPSATELLTNSFKIASLSAEVRRKMEAKAKRPRRTFVSATTKEYKYAAYMEAWRSKVERVGNLNYPEKARQQNLSGSLVLDVALNADGSINEITIRRSSGEKILDDAAIRIVELAAPYAPFPQHIKDETDILHIMRTWQFINNKGFR
ncbi:MAG: energy transducer TonB [Proteobacteria bacterium]|nr:energy transducer TonB [Pseudomonadota bacterium]